MAPSRRKKASAAAAAAAAQWKVGDLVLAKMKGFPAWPAMISEPEKWGLGSVKKKLLVYFYGTKQIAFCNYADLEAFTEEKKKTLLAKRQGKGADFVRAVEEIVGIYEDLKKQNGTVPGNDAQNLSTEISDNETLDKKQNIPYVDISSALPDQPQCIVNSEADDSMEKASSILDELRQAPFSTSITTKKRNRELQLQNPNPNKRTRLQQNANPSRSVEDDPTCSKINCTIPDLSPRTEVSEAGSGTSTGVGTGACDLPPTMVCFKRKRRPNRKRASTGIECSDKENNKGGLPDSAKSTSSLVKENNESAEVLSDSPNSRNNDVNKSDGDEHLPLVKRARVRMERSLVEEPKPNPIPKPNGDLDFFTVKTNGYVEAALPPSKRLHRALEAMSANVAEKREVDQTETTGSIDSMPNGHTQLLESSKLPPPVSSEAKPGIIVSSICDRSLKEDVILPVPEPSVINVPEPNVVHLPDPSTVPVWKPIIVPDQMSAPLENINKSETLVKFIYSLGENKDGPVEPTVKDACCTSSSVNDTKREVGKLVENNGPASSSENDAMRYLAESAKDLGPVSPSFSDIKMDPITEVAANLFSMKNSNTDTKNGVPAAPAEAGPLSKPVKGTNIDVILPLAATVGSMRISDNDTKKEIFNLAENVTLIDGANRGVVESALNLGPISSFDDGATTLVIGKLTPNVVPSSIDETKRDVTSIGRMSNFVYEIKRDVIAEPSANLGPPSAEFRENSQAVERRISPLLTSQESIPKAHPRDKCISPESTPMKDLIAAAQAKRILSRCFSVSENHIDSKTLVESPIDSRDGSSVGQPSPLNPAVRQSDCRTHTSGARSHAEAHAARKAFEAFLCTLTRTKDSIGRATRLAMECAKYGNAGEVMDIIIENVEKESNLHKRIDFFFLADSIMQWSRSQKGGPGDVYPSLVQSVFPRLMTLVAPPGVSAWENRKQCLKVLKLWMERKTLPEYLIRQHIRELESMNEASFSTASIRRGPTRTERAINDPLREMDGMLVDEYGSNTSFQLPPEFRATLLEVEGEEGTSSDEEREFEAVTPERDPHAISPNTDLTQMTTPNSSEKHTQSHVHTLVLAEVDGELEMEDVAPPPCDLAESLAVSGADSLVSGPEAQVEGSQEAEFAPPLPEDRPPSPPPLPSSPPPPPSLPPPPPLPQTIAYNPQNQPPSAVIDHSTNPNQATSKPMQFYNPAYRSHHPAQLPPPPPPPPPHGNNHPVSNHSVNNNFRQPVSQPSVHNNNSNNGYHMQPPPPPPPPVQNRYGYPQPEGGQHQPWKGPSRHSYPDNRYHPYSDVRDNRGSPYGDGRGFRGAMHSEDAAGHYGPSPSDRAPGPCAGWSMPPRIPPYPLPPARPTVEAPVSRVPGAHSYWRPR